MLQVLFVVTVIFVLNAAVHYYYIIIIFTIAMSVCVSIQKMFGPKEYLSGFIYSSLR